MRGCSRWVAAFKAWPVDPPSVVMPKAFQGTVWSNNTNTLFTFSIALTFALWAQKQWRVKLLVPQKKVQFVINDVNYVSGSNIFLRDMRTSVKHKAMKSQKTKP